tara:strand:- start:24 stop:458 length:435 start_codon:yes stop_codon:yes gene_type:complete
MKTLREFIKKEVKKISEEGMKSYPIPPEIRNALENDLKLKPLVRFVATTKAVTSVPPSYRVFFINNQYIDLIIQDLGIQALISHRKYWLHDTSEAELAIQAMNRILTQPIPKAGEEEGESSEEGGDTEMEPETGDEEETEEPAA